MSDARFAIEMKEGNWPLYVIIERNKVPSLDFSNILLHERRRSTS